ncbi:MAG TPA: hypothetical protein VKS21_02695 [Spirochaetota bacterium]|nr:hypothetical protein [Spirochaetota bacterium]
MVYIKIFLFTIIYTWGAGLFALTNIDENIAVREQKRLALAEQKILTNCKTEKAKKAALKKLIKLWQKEIKEVVYAIADISPTNCRKQFVQTVLQWQKVNKLEYAYLDRLYDGTVYGMQAGQVAVEVKLNVLKLRTMLMLKYLQITYRRNRILARKHREWEKQQQMREDALQDMDAEMESELNPYE